ncbi:MAG: hypothetical protein NC078_06690 [Ruminococcus sp.]|nr:hypothetical protein [Ruminococcus sp.]
MIKEYDGSLDRYLDEGEEVRIYGEYVWGVPPKFMIFGVVWVGAAFGLLIAMLIASGARSLLMLPLIAGGILFIKAAGKDDVSCRWGLTDKRVILASGEDYCAKSYENIEGVRLIKSRDPNVHPESVKKNVKNVKFFLKSGNGGWWLKSMDGVTFSRGNGDIYWLDEDEAERVETFLAEKVGES